MWNPFRRREQALERELRFHLEAQIEDYQAEGLPPAAARRKAQLDLGGLEQMKEVCRHVGVLGTVDAVLRDFRHASRRLLDDWRFTVGAVMLLALGIGPITTITSVINTALIRGLPFRDADRLVHVYENSAISGSPSATSFPVYLDIASFTEVFEAVSASSVPDGGVPYLLDGAIRSGSIEYATSTHLRVLGFRPAAGRWFGGAADVPGGPIEAVINYQTWQTEFNGDPAIAGWEILIDSVPVRVVGVGPENLSSSMTSAMVTDFWLSISAVRGLGSSPSAFPAGFIDSRGIDLFQVFARLQDDVTVPQARAAMDSLALDLAQYPDEDSDRGITVLTADEVYVHPSADPILVSISVILLTIVGLVLVIAYSNLATLLLVRGSARARETGVRLALGASRGQIIRFLMTEVIILAAVGGLGALVVASWTLGIVRYLNLGLQGDFSPDYGVFAFTLALALVCGIVFGLAPALRAARIDVSAMLRGEQTLLSPIRKRLTARDVLVVSQVVVSFLLLVCAGILVQSLIQESQQEFTFSVEKVAMLETDARYAGYGPVDQRIVYEELRNRIAALPGVAAATLTHGPPTLDWRSDAQLTIDGFEPPSGETSATVPWMLAGPGYFDTLEIPILFGRGFRTGDRANTPAVAVINQAMAERYFGLANPVGRRFRYADGGTQVEVIGVVPNMAGSAHGVRGLEPMFYRVFTQSDLAPTMVLARTTLDPAVLVGEMQRELRMLGEDLPVVLARTLEEHLRDPELAIAIGGMGALALFGLALAGLGLYTVVSHGVTSQTREIGIRMALGAENRGIIRLVTGGATGVVAVGLVLGLAVSLAAESITDWISLNPITLVTVASVMSAVALVAAGIPARRAVKLAPMDALRHD